MRGVWHAERVWSDERGVACREGVADEGWQLNVGHVGLVLCVVIC